MYVWKEDEFFVIGCKVSYTFMKSMLLIQFFSTWPCNVSGVLESMIIGLFMCLCTDLF